MNIFISWSGERSNKIAKLLYDYFSQNLQKTNPWLSSHIEKGKKWSSEITSELYRSNFGLIILTPENLDSHWILFEAGALSKLPASRVFTVLFDLEHNDIKPPLSQFQHTLFNKDDFETLIRTINKCCLDEIGSNLETSVLNSILTKSWSELKSDVETILKSKLIDFKKRTTDDKIDEILSITRSLEKRCSTVQIGGKFYQKCSDGNWREVVDPEWEIVSQHLVLDVQQALNKNGYKVDEDNVMGIETKKQLVQYQKDNKLPVGALDFETLKSLGIK
ncbi:MAG: TIR domain-containing protein [Saprospiraceae bacterium]